MDGTTLIRGARWGLTALTAVLVAAACDDGITDTHGPNEASTLSVYLKDAPGDVDSVWVQVDDVVLMGNGGGTSLLAEPTELLNITALTDSSAALVRDLEVDSGSYRQVRFVIGGAVLETVNEGVYVMGGAEHPGGLAPTGDLHCPSCAQSGLKIKLSEALELRGGENGLLLDFDVSQSFGHMAGQSGRWIMHPVIHGAGAEPGEIENDQAGGSILGTVALGDDDQGDPVVIPTCGGEARTLEQFVPRATATTLVDDEGDPLTFAGETESEDEGFVFEIEVTELDAYDLGFASETIFDTEQLVWTGSVEPTQVTLNAEQNEVDGVSYMVTGVTCEAVSP